MFPRPPFHHPYKRSTPISPAGFRIVDYINPKRCFNVFQGHNVNDTRSPSPSPGLRHQEDNAPPTICLADYLKREGIGAPARPTTPTPDHPRNAMLNTKKNHVRPRQHGPKHLSFQAPHRRAHQLKEKHAAARRRFLDHHQRRIIRARQGLRRLRREAETLMKPQHMTDEDRIFLTQLENLHVDHVCEHGLEDHRQQLRHAADEFADRQLEHEKRDAQTAKTGERTDEDARKDQERKVAEWNQAKQDAREARQAHLRRREERALRADEARQRAHEAQERKAREEQERIFREELACKAKEEQERRKQVEERRLREERAKRQLQEKMERLGRETRARFLREARDRILREEQQRRAKQERDRLTREKKERQAREEQERLAREEQERQAREEWERRAREQWERQAREEREHQARFLAEQARRATEDEQIRQHFAVYEGKWNELHTNKSLNPIGVLEMPWPVFGVVSSVDQITYQGIRAFLFHPQRPGVEGKTARDVIKLEMLRFHPDKFNSRAIPKIQPSQHAVAQEICGAIARILTRILTEEVEKQK